MKHPAGNEPLRKTKSIKLYKKKVLKVKEAKKVIEKSKKNYKQTVLYNT